MNTCSTIAAAPWDAACAEVPGDEEELDPTGDDSSAEVDSALAVELTPDASEVEARLVGWETSFEIQTPFQAFQLRQLVTETLRMERCQNEEWALIRRSQNRALGSWDADRGSEAIVIAGKLSRNPERWRCELLLSAHGVRWMINQWKQLRQALQSNNVWDDRQRTRALDLLGVPTLFRKQTTAIDLPLEELDARIGEEIAELEGRLEGGLDQIDQVYRTSAEQGHGAIDDKRLWAIRRFESGCFRRFQQLLKVLPPKATKSERPAYPAWTGEKKKRTVAPRARLSQDEQFLATVADAIQTVAKPNVTEQLSRRLSPEAPPLSETSPAAEFAPSTRPKNPPPLSGNRRQRRHAAAMAKKGR